MKEPTKKDDETWTEYRIRVEYYDHLIYMAEIQKYRSKKGGNYESYS